MRLVGVKRRYIGKSVTFIVKAVTQSPAFVVLTTLVVINAVTFYEHYLGRMTFPWDFFGGYHTHAYGWFAQSTSFFDPPRWFPWGDLGFPAFLALQSGAWYLPLVLLDILGITYDIVTATRLQSLHVLFGALGVVAFLRLYGMSWSVALIGAICYHFSVTFYSNQQHVDIIRGAAWMPFVLTTMSPKFLAASRFAPALSAVVLFQFFVSAYPGLIISTAYATLVVMMVTLIQDRSLLQLRTVVHGAIALAAGILMAGLKFLPLLLHGDLVMPEMTAFAAIRPEFIPTLFLPYDVAFLPGDVTMRSLWLPSVALLSIVFLRRLAGIAAIGLSLTAIAVLLGGIVPTISPSLDALLGFNISRFPLSDWRPVLHLGIICLAAESLRQVLKAACPLQPFILRLVAFSCVVLVSLWTYTIYGYGGPHSWGVVLFVVPAAAILAILNGLNQESGLRGLRYACLIGLVCLATLNGLWFHTNEARPWMHLWSAEIEKQIFRGPVVFHREAIRAELSRRPERFVVGEKMHDILAHANSLLYNRNWYEKTFGLFGYNNLRLSMPHVGLRAALKDETNGPALLAFIRKPQQLVILPEEAVFDASQLPAQDVRPVISFVDGVEAEIVQYSPDHLRYRIITPVAIRVVENEIWASGWRLRLSNDRGDLEVNVEHTSEFLRTWIIPPGRWDISLRFGEDVYSEAWIAWWVGLSLALLSPWLRLPSFPREWKTARAVDKGAFSERPVLEEKIT